MDRDGYGICEGLVMDKDKLQRAVELRKEALKLERAAFAERPLPDKWKVGMRVRFLRGQEWAWSAGSEAIIVELSPACKNQRANEYQVFWTRPDNNYAIWWTTPDAVELVSLA